MNARIRRSLVLLVLAPFALTACQGQPASPTTTTPAPTATTASSTPAGSASPSKPASASATSATPSAATPSTGPASPPLATMTPVTAADYLIGAGEYRFASPSGHLRCGLSAGLLGCQSDRVVANLPQCNAPTVDSAPIVTLRNGEVKTDCTRQGVFVSENAKVLPYGHTLQMGEYTCGSSTEGVQCQVTSGGQVAFFASAEYFGDASKR